MLSQFSHVWLCKTMDCSLPDSSVHGILQARIQEWVPIPSSKGSSGPRDQTHVKLEGIKWFLEFFDPQDSNSCFLVFLFLLLYCCTTNHQKLNDLKQYTLIHSWFWWLEARPWHGCNLFSKYCKAEIKVTAKLNSCLRAIRKYMAIIF